MKSLVQKIGLGTVQFGLNYGINNSIGQIQIEEIKRILQKAQEIGIETIDTARAYGNSEESLGKCLPSPHFFKIVSKFSKKPNEILSSLQFLGVESLYAYLFHSFDTFSSNPTLFEELLDYQKGGKTHKIGFSLYYPHELEQLLAKNIALNLVQIPYNIFDRRFEYLLPELKKQNIEIHVRSIFLQGLFFKNIVHLSRHFDSVKPILKQLKQISEQLGFSIQGLCLAFGLMNSKIDKIIVGVDSLDNLLENIHSLSEIALILKSDIAWNQFEVDDLQILLPFNWK